MQQFKTVAVIAAITFSIQASAQAPVVSVGEPESHFSHVDPQLHANKQVALHIMRELLQCNQWRDAGQWMTERYIQHNPNLQSGLAPVIEFFTANTTPDSDCPELTTPIVAVQAEGDLVTVMRPREYPHPTREGETYTTTWYDTWRIVDGKADEHWDSATIAAPVQVSHQRHPAQSR